MAKYRHRDRHTRMRVRTHPYILKLLCKSRQMGDNCQRYQLTGTALGAPEFLHCCPFIYSVLTYSVTPDIGIPFCELSWIWPHLRTLTELWGSAKLHAVVRHVHGMKGSVPHQLWCWDIPRTSLCTSHYLTCYKTIAEKYKKLWEVNDAYFSLNSSIYKVQLARTINYNSLVHFST